MSPVVLRLRVKLYPTFSILVRGLPPASGSCPPVSTPVSAARMEHVRQQSLLGRSLGVAAPLSKDDDDAMSISSVVASGGRPATPPLSSASTPSMPSAKPKAPEPPEARVQYMKVERATPPRAIEPSRRAVEPSNHRREGAGESTRVAAAANMRRIVYDEEVLRT